MNNATFCDCKRHGGRLITSNVRPLVNSTAPVIIQWMRCVILVMDVQYWRIFFFQPQPWRHLRPPLPSHKLPNMFTFVKQTAKTYISLGTYSNASEQLQGMNYSITRMTLNSECPQICLDIKMWWAEILFHFTDVIGCTWEIPALTTLSNFLGIFLFGF